MDPPQRQNGPIQRQDASVSDLPMPLTEDLRGMDLYEYIDSTEDNITHLLVAPTGSQPKPPADLWGCMTGGPGNTDGQSTNGPPPVRRPPPPLRTRLPSACLPGRQSSGPPPVPPRTRVPLSKKLSCDLPEPAHRFNRSRTEIDNHVSISDRFPLGKDKELLYDSIKLTKLISCFFFSTTGSMDHQTYRHTARQHQESCFFLCCNFQVRSSSLFLPIKINSYFDIIIFHANEINMKYWT